MSRQVLVQRLLLPGNGNVNSTIQTNNNSVNTSGDEIVTTSSPTAASEPAITIATNTTGTNSSNEVPWNHSDEYKQRITTEIKPATTTTTTEATITSNETTAYTTDECNTTFLNALALTNFEELPQTSTSQYQQHYRDIQEQIRDRIDGAPSVDSAFDESSSKLTFFLSYFYYLNK